MTGEYETSPIVTMLKFITDDTGIRQATEAVRKYESGINEVTRRQVIPYKPLGEFVVETIKPMQNLEDRLDISATVDTSTKAVKRYDEEFSKLAKTTESFEGLEDRLDISKTMENSWGALRKFDTEFTSAITPVQNLENQLDSMNGAFRGSTEALVVSDSEFNNLYGNLLNVDQAINHTATSIERYGKTTQMTTTITNQFGDVIATNTRTMEQNYARFNMWALSIMFFGMQIQRIFGKMWTGMKDAYFKITENTTALGQANLRLSASMTFLQVSIMTTLEPALLPLVETIIDLVNWFSELPESVKEVAGLFIIFGLGAGTIMSALGSITMFISMGLVPLIGKIAGPGGVSAAISSIGSSFMGILPLAIVAALAIYSIWKEIGPMLAWENKKSLDIQKEDWTSYKLHALAENIELQILIPKILYRLLFTVGDIFEQFRALMGNVFYGILEGLTRVGALIPGPMGEAFAQVNAELIDMQTEYNKKSADIRTKAMAGFTTMQEGLTSTAIIEMAKMGVSMEDIIDVYGNTGETITSLTEAYKGNSDQLLKLHEYINNLKTTLPETTSVTDILNTSFSQTKSLLPQIDIEMSSLIEKTNLLTEANNGLIESYSKLPYGAIGIHMSAQGSEYIYETPTTPTTTITPSITQNTNAFASNFIQPTIQDAWNKLTGLAQGGIVTQPTIAKIGENYQPEAIIPLDKLDRIINQPPSINVGDINVNVTTGPVNNDLDMKDLANKISEEIMRDIRNYTKYVPQW